jgi:hypothetical protein
VSGYYYPQASLVLRILWEDFKLNSDPNLAKEYVLPVLARSVRVHINDYAHADTFDAEIDYKNFPFDPRTIRSVGVSVFMEDMKRVYQSNNAIEQIVPSDDNAIFLGFADEESITFNDTKRTVRLEGRDFTSLFLDRKFPRGTVNLEQTVDQVIQSILDELPENRNGRIRLDNRVSGSLPILSSFYSEKDQLSGKRNVRKEESFWELIQNVSSQAGLIAYMELDKLVLSKPRVLYDKKKTVYMVYGKNLSDLEFKRKIGRRKNFNIVVRSLNLNTKEVIEARIPADATEEWSTATGIPREEVLLKKLGADGKPLEDSVERVNPAPYIAYLVPNAPNKNHLVSIGQEIYEEISRQEIEGSLSTKDMSSSYYDAESGKVVSGEFNLLKLKVGTPISIEIEQDDLDKIARMSSVEDRVTYLQQRSYPTKVARVFAETLGRVATPFYTRGVEYSMDAESGFSCKIEFINFIETANKAFSGKVS